MSRHANSKLHCQIFVRHLDRSTSDSTFESYFSRYGKVVFHKIMRDKNGRSRGLGLIEYEYPETAKSVLEMKNHQVDGHRVECKPSRPKRRNLALADKYKAIPKHLKKIYVGDLGPQITEDQLKQYFSKFGRIEEAFTVKDKDKKSKGFGFVSFDHPCAVDQVQEKRPHKIANREVQTVRAYPENTDVNDRKPTTMLYVLNYKDGIDVDDVEEYFSKFGDIGGVSFRNKKAENLKYIELEFEDYDSVDVICLTKHHTIKDNRLTVRKYLSKSQVESNTAESASSSQPKSKPVNRPTPTTAPCAPPLDDLRPPAFNPYHQSPDQLYPSLPPRDTTYANLMPDQSNQRTSGAYSYTADQLGQFNGQNRQKKASNDKNCVIS